MSLYTKADVEFDHVSGIKYASRFPIVWNIGRVDSGLTVIVPPGFVFDVSIPRWLRWLISPHEKKFFKAAALHDRLLKEGWTRIAAGAVFHDALRADGVPAWLAIIMWLAVSLWRYR